MGKIVKNNCFSSKFIGGASQNMLLIGKGFSIFTSLNFDKECFYGKNKKHRSFLFGL